jgi:hypothetical protein
VAFLAVAAAPAADEDDAQYRHFRVHLRRARSRFFKPVLLSWLGRITALVLAALLGLAIYGLVRVDAVRDFLASVLGRRTELWVVLLVALGVAILAFLYLSARLWRPVRWVADRLYTQAVPALLAIPFWVGALVVLLFSRIFVRIGRVGRVLG